MSKKDKKQAATASEAPEPLVDAPGGPVQLVADMNREASAGAPFLYFDQAGVSGHLNGVIRVTLEAGRIMPGENNKVFQDRVVVGHLRMTLPAARSLRSALDRALLIAAPPPSQASN